MRVLCDWLSQEVESQQLDRLMCSAGHFESKAIIHNIESWVNKLTKKRMFWLWRDKMIETSSCILEKFWIKGIFPLKMVKKKKGYGNEPSQLVIKDWCLWQIYLWYWSKFFSSFIMLGERVKIFSSWLSPNWQIHKALVPIQAELMWGCILRRILVSVTSEIVSNYFSEFGSQKEWSYTSREVILWTWQPYFSEPFIRLLLGMQPLHLL